MEEPQEKARTCAHNGKCFPPSSLSKVAKWASALTLQLVLKKRGRVALTYVGVAGHEMHTSGIRAKAKVCHLHKPTADIDRLPVNTL